MFKSKKETDKPKKKKKVSRRQILRAASAPARDAPRVEALGPYPTSSTRGSLATPVRPSMRMPDS